MDFKQYTIKSQEAIQKAVELCAAQQQQVIEPAHLLKGILTEDENVTDFLFKKLGANTSLLERKLEDLIATFPKTSGQQPYLSNAANQVLIKAKDFLKPFGDEFIAIEHLLLAILATNDKAGQLLKDQG